MTPAGTVIATTLCLTCTFVSYLGAVADNCYNLWTPPDTVLRIVPIIFILIAIAISFKPAMRELREGTTNSQRNERSQNLQLLEDDQTK